MLPEHQKEVIFVRENKPYSVLSDFSETQEENLEKWAQFFQIPIVSIQKKHSQF